MQTQTLPTNSIFFILGPPGVGKSTYGKLLAEHLGYNYFELDDIQKSNSPVLAKNIKDIILKKFFFKRMTEKPKKIAQKLNEFIQKNNKTGIVVGFRCKPYYTIHDCLELKKHGITAVYLNGPAYSCMQAFLKRDQGKKASYWMKKSIRIFDFIEKNHTSAPQFFIDTIMQDGQRTSLEEFFSKINHQKL